MNWKRWVRSALISSIIWLGFHPSLGAQNTEAAGGIGGTSFVLKCPEGQVLVGLAVTYGEWINWVRPSCKKVYMDGLTMSTSMSPGSAGVEEGSGARTDCRGSREAIKGFKGREGWYVNSLILICYPLGSSARTIFGPGPGDYPKLGLYGVDSGTAFGPYTCGEDKPAIGIFGKAGLYIDSFGLICGYIMPSAPILVAPANGVDVTNRRPSFDWDMAYRFNRPYRICINQRSDAKCSIAGTITAQIEDPATQWTPSVDLPFARGSRVYWRVEVCNDNGCKHTIRQFRYMPLGGSRVP